MSDTIIYKPKKKVHMGLISFLKGAGEKVFGKSDETLEKEKAEAIVNHINKYDLKVKDLVVTVDGETVTLNGEVSSVLERNRVVVVTGNVAGISAVNDNLILNVPEPVEPEKQYYTVVKGDYLSKISKRSSEKVRSMKLPILKYRFARSARLKSETDSSAIEKKSSSFSSLYPLKKVLARPMYLRFISFSMRASSTTLTN